MGSPTRPQYFRCCAMAGASASGSRRFSSRRAAARLAGAGTVGYEFLNEVCALFVDAGPSRAFTELWIRASGDHVTLMPVAIDAKLEHAQTTFAPEIEWLARAVEADAALESALASMPVYRTYIDPQSGEVAEQDRAAIDRARMPAGIARRLLLERETPRPSSSPAFSRPCPP